jgi:hypothetical protein
MTMYVSRCFHALICCALALTTFTFRVHGADSTNRWRLPDDLNKIVRDPAKLVKPEGLTVACYTFPNYHPSALQARLCGPGWTEYVLTRAARPWFPGHQQPRTPLLGELDESKPETWDRYNELAEMHGVDVFIWDWYWYDGGPQLHEALEEGFLLSRNRQKVKFAVMWTNHPWYILFPTVNSSNRAAYPPSFDAPDSSKTEAWRSLSYAISRYFHQPNYWRIDGKPVLCIWDPGRLVRQLGLADSKALLTDLRAFAAKLGHPGIHYHASGFYSPHCKELGFDTYGSYNPVDHVARTHQPKTVEFPDYGIAAADVVTKQWTYHAKEGSIPYIPGLGAGWDSTPRFAMPMEPRPAVPNRDVWPRCAIMANESPGAFKAFVQAGFAYLHEHPEAPRILTISCWNEWSEGHYLLPDNRFGYGMLDALAEALGKPATHKLHGR